MANVVSHVCGSQQAPESDITAAMAFDKRALEDAGAADTAASNAARELIFSGTGGSIACKHQECTAESTLRCC